jgi:hypothetical protein
MTRKKWIILAGLLGAFGLFGLLTGGLVVASRNHFGGQSDIRLVPGLRSDIALSPKSSRFDIPFVFHYYRAEKPFSLRLQIWDDSKQYRSIDIIEVLVEYKDGEVVRKTETWSRQLKPYTGHYHSSSGLYQTEMFMLSDQIEGLVLRHADVKITLKGQLTKADGVRVPFEVSESFVARSDSGVTFYWLAIANV